MPLPENIDDSYPDIGGASRKFHQQHHDVIHPVVNAVEAAYSTAVVGGFVGTVEDWLSSLSGGSGGDLAFQPVGETALFTKSSISWTTRITANEALAMSLFRYTDEQAAGDQASAVFGDFGDWLSSPADGGLCQLADGLYHIRFVAFSATPVYTYATMGGLLGAYNYVPGTEIFTGGAATGQIVAPSRVSTNTFAPVDFFMRLNFLNSSRVAIASGTGYSIEVHIAPILLA